jgi:hypothetical protein
MKKIKATTIKTDFHIKNIFLYYTKKGEFMQLSLRSFRLATCSLTGSKKPGGRESHPHHLPLRKARKQQGHT